MKINSFIISLVLLATGCQASQPSAIKAKAAVAHKGVDDAFDLVDGTAVALEEGKQDAKEAAKDLHGAVKAGKGSNGDSKAATAALEASLVKALEDAAEAKEALQDRARNRIEWILSIIGIVCWLGAAGIVYSLVQGGGAASLLSGSIIRRSCLIGGLLLTGCACFAAAVYFDQILKIGAWTLGSLAVGVLVAAVLHYRKHFKKAVGK